jgi:hypothetical protein
MVILHTRPSDSEGYTHLILDGQIGQAGAGVEVTGDMGEESWSLIMHGQHELDVPNEVTVVVFPDGTEWKPE